jgi:hypothetical protein
VLQPRWGVGPALSSRPRSSSRDAGRWVQDGPARGVTP